MQTMGNVDYEKPDQASDRRIRRHMHSLLDAAKEAYELEKSGEKKKEEHY